MKKLFPIPFIIAPTLFMMLIIGMIITGGSSTGGETPRPNTPKADIYLYTASGNLINHWEAAEVSFSSSADRIYFTDLEGVEHVAYGTYTVQYRD